MGSMERSAVFSGIEMGIGTWSWGDRLIWNYGNGYDYQDIRQAFVSAVEFGFRFFDTAEIYGQGRSETYLGDFIRGTDDHLVIASKFMPFPWRWSTGALKKALTGSLHRLNLDRISLYQMHQALPPVKIESWMGQMAEVVHSGLVGAVGVSNYDLNQTWQAQNTLVREGLRLASTQMEYSLLDRGIEKSGIMDLCREQGITIIAYSPLAMGMLSGKYSPGHPPGGYRAVKYSASYLEKINPLLTEMRRIGREHDGKTPSQVALNWVICKGAIPIPGEKNPRQVEENAGAVGWRLSEDEVALLDQVSDRVTQN